MPWAKKRVTKNNLVHCKQGELNSSKHSVVLQRIDGRVNLRIVSHPVLQEIEDVKWVEITVDGRKIRAREGESIAAAMLAANIRIARYTSVRSEPRGLFCGIGQCSDCMMIVNGVPNVKTCVTLVADGMVVQTQYGTEGPDYEDV